MFSTMSVQQICKTLLIFIACTVHIPLLLCLLETFVNHVSQLANVASENFSEKIIMMQDGSSTFMSQPNPCGMGCHAEKNAYEK